MISHGRTRIAIGSRETAKDFAYIYEDRDGRWLCAGADGTPMGSWPGIDDRMSLTFALEDADSKNDVLLAVHKYASRYKSGANHGLTVYLYALWEG